MCVCGRGVAEEGGIQVYEWDQVYCTGGKVGEGRRFELPSPVLSLEIGFNMRAVFSVTVHVRTEQESSSAFNLLFLGRVGCCISFSEPVDLQ